MGTWYVLGMRWTVEADTARDVVSWPEEFDDFSAALRSHLDAESANCYVDPVAGSLSARFQVNAEREADAKAAARRIMLDALENAGLRRDNDPLAHVEVTPMRTAP